MKRMLWLSILMLPCGSGVRAQQAASPLARPVRPVLTNAPLSQLLADFSRQSGVPVSYSSTRINVRRRCRMQPGPPRALGLALREVATQLQLSYGLLNGQLVVWPAAAAPPPGIRELNGLGQPVSRPLVTGPAMLPAGREGVARGWPPTVRPAGLPIAPSGQFGRQVIVSQPGMEGGGPMPGNPALGGRTGRGGAGLERRLMSLAAPAAPTTAAPGRRGHFGQTPPLAGISRHGAARPGLAGSSTAGAAGFAPLRLRIIGRAGIPNAVAIPAVLAVVPLAFNRSSRVATRRQLGQVSLLPPLSSSWLANSRTVNDYSLNVLAGYSAGVRRLEIGGLLNVVRDTVRGLQAAGIANVTGTDVRGVQLAGVVNVNGGAMRGVQGAGLVNIARDDARGLQIAGLVNFTGGAAHANSQPDQPTRLRRWLGLPRLLATAPLAQLPAAPSANQPGVLVQAAALANLTGTDVRGLQTSALVNLAHHVSGAQLGLVNVARHVRGVQFGLVNFADSVDGVSLGIISIVRHGYLHGEVWTSESLPLNAVVKLGVRRYYTLLGAAAEPFGSRVQWAAGFGVGTAGRPHGRFTFSLDAIQWTLAGSSIDDNGNTIDDRLLTQLRPAVAWQIEHNGRLQLVLAPTLNLAIAWSNDHQPQWDFGANQLLLINTAGAQSRTRLWPGVQVGLRF